MYRHAMCVWKFHCFCNLKKTTKVLTWNIRITEHTKTAHVENALQMQKFPHIFSGYVTISLEALHVRMQCIPMSQLLKNLHHLIV